MSNHRPPSDNPLVELEPHPLPPFPTIAPPGSAAKMTIMRWRFMRGEQLHHPDDNKEVDQELIDPFNGERAYAGEDLDTGLMERSDLEDVA